VIGDLMGFWASELQRCKDAIAYRRVDQYLLASVENSREMRTTYATFGNVQGWLENLEMKAAEEAQNITPGSIFFSIGGT
jgi:hypothetical protein